MATHWKHYCTIEVDGIPKAQGRPRATKMGNHVRVYNPKNADSWRERVGYGTTPHRPTKPFDGAVRIDVKWKMPRPKSLMRKKDPEGEIPCTKKPDRDNLDKVILDAMKDAGWIRDDAIVCYGILEKCYHSKDGIPGATITIYTWGSILNA